MSIPLKRYVNITSGVGAGASVSTRALIARIFTTNHLVPTDGILEFTSADDVGTYFGTTSEEYLRAAFYFGWTSKNITRPQKIAFARWTNLDVAPEIFGAVQTQAIATWNAITTGSFNLVIGGVSRAVTGINFSGAANLAAVAALIQTAVRAIVAGGTQFTAATVVYNSTRGSFDFVGGATGAATITVTAGTSGTDIAGQLGWLSPTATIFSAGATAQTITQLLTSSTDLSNSFGSFTFTTAAALNQAQIVEAATWNDTQNIMFMYSVAVSAANAAAYSAALASIGGVGLTLAPLATEYPEMAPMMILAATNYAQPNSTQNYEFQQFSLTPSVLTETDANTYDGLRINYYGQTQTAGNTISFYQQGVLMGLAVDPADMNTYANEQWLKDAMSATIMTLLLALSKISANSTGRSQILNSIQSIIDLALFNGTISTGKPLTAAQKSYIVQITNDPRSYYQVATDGYWVDVVITPYTVLGVTKYKAVYTLVYSKDDVIRLVEGRDILI